MITLLRTVILSLTLTLSASSIALAQEQRSTTEDSQNQSTWVAFLPHQVFDLLGSERASAHEDAMQLVLRKGALKDAEGNRKFDFSLAAPRLLDIYTSDEHTGRRLLALEALRVVGGPYVAVELRERLRTEDSELIRRRTAVAITTLEE